MLEFIHLEKGSQTAQAGLKLIVSDIPHNTFYNLAFYVCATTSDLIWWWGSNSGLLTEYQAFYWFSYLYSSKKKSVRMFCILFLLKKNPLHSFNLTMTTYDSVMSASKLCILPYYQRWTIVDRKISLQSAFQRSVFSSCNNLISTFNEVIVSFSLHF